MSIYKRGYRRDTLTGGSKDVNPQYMNLSVTETGADTYTQVTFPIPIQRLQNAGRAQVMEVLKVLFNVADWATSAAGQTASSALVQLTTKSFAAAVNLAEPTCFALFDKSQSGAFTAAGTYQMSRPYEPAVFDMTDGAGHGILIASDNIFMAVSSTSTGGAIAAQVKIIYRWKDVSIQEYVGIVQSQQ